MKTPTNPIRETYPNPLAENKTPSQVGDWFTHYELQSVREYQDHDGTRFFEVCQDNEDMLEDHPGRQACGPVMVGLYGRLNKGGVEHLIDFSSRDKAIETLSRMGVPITP